MLFSTEMVQAILAGNKTQTRLIGALKNIDHRATEILPNFDWPKQGNYAARYLTQTNPERYEITDIVKAPCIIGDVIWVRETYQKVTYKGKTEYLYKADDHNDTVGKITWKPSIHMPKEAARIWLRVINVRPDRLNDITEEDAKKEGVFYSYSVNRNPGVQYKNYLPENKGGPTFSRVTWSFQSLWATINGQDSWNQNPWVWVIEFEVISVIGKPENIKG